MSGRAEAQAVLDPLLAEQGWRRRAAGWWTRPAGPGAMAVLALGVAPLHQAAGAAAINLTVGLRDEAVELLVGRCVEVPTGYRQRTWVAPLASLLPEPGWAAGERVVDATSAADGSGLSALVASYGWPRVVGLVGDDAALLTAVSSSAAGTGAPGLCRVAALTARVHGQAPAQEVVASWVAALGERADAAATLERAVAERLREELLGE